MQKVIHQIQKTLSQLLVSLPIVALVILMATFINIYINNSISNSFAITDEESYNFTVSDTTTLTVSLPSPEALALTPTANGKFGSKSISVGVSTNNPYGYSLTMSASTSSLSRSEAVNGETPTIPTLDTSVSEDDFPNNRWGFKRTSSKFTDTMYNPMTASSNIPVDVYSGTTNGTNSTITFGVKLDNIIPSSTYNINLDFLAVTNITSQVNYLQNATPSSLAGMMPSVGSTATLYDSRDQQAYTVAKLADGKYWMTKNLNLAGGTTLTSSDTDMPAGYALPTENGFQEDNKLPESSLNGFDDDLKAFVYNTGNNTDTCTSSGCYSYYSWRVATLGSSQEVSPGNNVDAPHSICPSGWRLPKARYTSTFDSGIAAQSDFYTLAVLYGLSSTMYNEQPDESPKVYTEIGPNTIANFVYSGHITGASSQPATQAEKGIVGRLWSSTISNTNGVYAYNFLLDNNRARTGHVDVMKFGMAVRCIFGNS